MRKLVDMSNVPDKKQDKVKKGSQYTAALKPVNETKYCKDCKEYRAKKCKNKYIARKKTCDSWSK